MSTPAFSERWVASKLPFATKRDPRFLEPDCGSLTHNIGLVVGANLGAKCSPSGS